MKKSRPVRVLQVVTSMNRAGLETMLMNYYRNIDRTKVQFDFLVHRLEDADYDQEILALGGKIHHFPPITITSMSTYAAKMKRFLLEHPEYEIVHSHLDSLSTLPLVGAKNAGVPVRIAHSHNNGFSFDAKYPLREILKRMISHYATDLFACSNSAGDFMFGKTQYKIIKNAIDTRQFKFNQATRSRLRKDLDVGSSFVVGHVGRFTHQKNHTFLIDIFAKLLKKKPNAVLLLVGNGETEKFVRAKVKRLGLKNKVQFLGSRSNIPDIMQAMDIFVLPSHYEGLGIVAIEAQTTGLPCVLSAATSKSTKIAATVEYVSLEAGEKAWVDAIESLPRNSRRSDQSQVIKDAGYDIASEALHLQRWYIESTKGHTI